MNLNGASSIKTCLIRYFGYLNRDKKQNWVSASLSSKMHDLSVGQGMAKYQVVLEKI